MSGTWVLVVLILISSIPVAVVYLWFRREKYQLSFIRFLFILLTGASAFFPALILQDLLRIRLSAGSRGEVFYELFIRIALTEEISRLLMLLIFLWICSLIKPGDGLNEPVTSNSIKKGTAIGLVAGLGFAILESARYAASDMSINIVLLRFFTAALHGACGSRIGAAAVLFKESPIKALMRIFTAIAIHGVYNFMIDKPGIPSVAAMLIAISALATAILSIRGGWSKEEPSATTLDKSKENT